MLDGERLKLLDRNGAEMLTLELPAEVPRAISFHNAYYI